MWAKDAISIVYFSVIDYLIITNPLKNGSYNNVKENIWENFFFFLKSYKMAQKQQIEILPWSSRN